LRRTIALQWPWKSRVPAEQPQARMTSTVNFLPENMPMPFTWMTFLYLAVRALLGAFVRGRRGLHV